MAHRGADTALKPHGTQDPRLPRTSTTHNLGVYLGLVLQLLTLLLLQLGCYYYYSY